MTFARLLIAAIGLLLYSEPSQASGDVGVVYLFGGQALGALLLAVLVFTKIKTWSDRVFMLSLYFGPLVVGLIATRHVPYESNRYWLIPLLLGPPLASCGIGALVLGKSRRREV